MTTMLERIVGRVNAFAGVVSEALPSGRPWPYGRTLIQFDCRGCMAEDWRETDRGVIVDQVSRKIYGGNPNGTLYWGIIYLTPEMQSGSYLLVEAILPDVRRS